jgi:hypothetical protein
MKLLSDKFRRRVSLGREWSRGEHGIDEFCSLGMRVVLLPA